MSVLSKNARQENYAKDFDHVHYPQTTEDLTQICQELAGDYDTIFYASFDNSLILDLVASSNYQHLMSFDDGYADIYPLGMYALPLQPSQVGSLGLTRDDLIERTEKHFTLYRSDYHVVAREKLVYLEHFFDLPQAPVSMVRRSRSCWDKSSLKRTTKSPSALSAPMPRPWPLTSIYPIPRKPSLSLM